MAVLRIPTPLRAYTGGESEVTVHGKDVSEAIEALVGKHPALRQHLFNGNGGLRPFVNVFKGEDNINDLQGMETSLDEEDRLIIIPSIAGG